MYLLILIAIMGHTNDQPPHYQALLLDEFPTKQTCEERGKRIVNTFPQIQNRTMQILCHEVHD